MGNLFGGTKTSTQTPWAPQASQLTHAFDSAQSLYDSKANTPWYQGELYAGMDPTTKQALTGMVGYSQGQGAANATNLNGAGTDLLNPGLYQGAMGNYAAAAGADPTQGNIAAATAYANNPALNGAIDAASRDVVRNLNENQLTGINAAASGSGNVNSTRAGVASGIAQRGAADQIGDIASTVRSNALNNGLNLAENARSTNLGAMGNAAGMYGTALNQGAGLIGQGNAMAGQNFSNAATAGDQFQQDKQGADSAGLQAWQGNDTRSQQLLQNYYNIIGANNWGGKTTQSQSGGLLGNILGAASSISGMGGFGGIAKSLFG